MKKRIVSLLLCAAMLTGCGGFGSAGTNELTPDKPNVEESKEASLEGLRDARKSCYDILRTQTDIENPMLSPISAYIALSMVTEGAKGETKAQLEDLLGSEYREISEKLMEAYQIDKEGLAVQVSNAIWVDDDFDAMDTWLDVVSGYYKSAVYQKKLDDAGVVSEINAWVKEKTHDKIDKMLDEPLSERARVALFNAVFFDGEWETPFEKDNTKKEDFVTEDGTKVSTDMMNQYAEYLTYISADYADGVVLPYEDGNFALVAIKPTKEQTARELLGQLNEESMSKLLASAEEKKMNLKLPKYEVEFDRVLNDAFISLGVTDAFSDEKADFTDMGTSSDNMNVYISLIRQRAVFKLDEEGTEAAAVTGIMIEATAALPEMDEPINVYFNEPFVYMIMDMETELPLFMGVMDNPTLE